MEGRERYRGVNGLDWVDWENTHTLFCSTTGQLRGNRTRWMKTQREERVRWRDSRHREEDESVSNSPNRENCECRPGNARPAAPDATPAPSHNAGRLCLQQKHCDNKKGCSSLCVKHRGADSSDGRLKEHQGFVYNHPKNIMYVVIKRYQRKITEEYTFIQSQL